METKLEQSSEEAKAPAAVEPVEEPKVPLHEHTALRTRARDAELANAKLQGQLEVLTAQKATEQPAALSPMDAEIARQLKDDPDLTEEDITVSAKVWKDQQLYDQQVANQAAQAEASANLAVSQQASAKTFRLVHDDYDQVIHDGENLLTPGQKLDVLAAGGNFGQVSYDMCKNAIEASKPAPKSSKPEPEPEPEPKPAPKVDPASRDEILNGVSMTTARVMNL